MKPIYSLVKVVLLLLTLSPLAGLWGQSNTDLLRFENILQKRAPENTPLFRQKLSEQTPVSNSGNNLFSQTPAQRTCATMEVDAQLRAQHPEMGTLDQFEQRMQQLIQEHRHELGARNLDVLTIPIIVHIVHNGEAVGVGQNISQAQVMSQIQVLNEDYRRNGAGFNNHPSGADVEIEFAPAVVDPQGNPLAEPGIHRVNGGRPAWSRDDIQQTLKPNTQWDPNRYFNMWTVTFGGDDTNLLGYAQFPSLSGLQGFMQNEGSPQTDGVVIRANSFGRIGNVTPPYDRGRTATHEVGHWLGLRHIWGDGDCSADDFCADTPNASHPNYQCVPINSCPGEADDMIQNYMDYTPDDCMNIVTNDQKSRIRTVFMVSPRRKELPMSTVHIGNGGGGGNPVAPVTNFTVNRRNACTGTALQFTDQSLNNPTSWQWSVLDYNGLVQGNYTSQNPSISFNNPGIYSVRLTTTNAVGSNVKLEENYITILQNNSVNEFQEDFEDVSNLLSDWVLYNPDADRTFALSNYSSYGVGEISVVFDNYSSETDPTGTVDAIISPRLNLNNASNPYLYFEHAYAQYGELYSDTLVLFYSIDCGQTFHPFFFKGGEDLATAPATEDPFEPANNQWSWNQISLGFLSGQSSVHILIANISGWGNNLYIDQLAYVDAVDYTTGPVETDFGANRRIICAGDEVAFQDYSSNFPTVWSWEFEGGQPSLSGQQHPYIQYNTPGYYDVSLNASNLVGGGPIEAIDYIQVLPLPNINVTVNTTQICPGDQITLTASGAQSYQWFDDRGTLIFEGSSLQAAIYSTAQITVVGESSAGCLKEVTFGIPVLSTPVPVITQINNTLVASAGVWYQWYVNGVVIPAAQGGNQSIIQPIAAGTYYVEVQYNNGCSNVSDGYPYNPVSGVAPIDISQQVVAFPNPTNSDVTVRMENDLIGAFQLRLINAFGQEVTREKIVKQATTVDTSLQMNALPSGWYMVEIQGDQYFAVKKIIKQ